MDPFVCGKAGQWVVVPKASARKRWRFVHGDSVTEDGVYFSALETVDDPEAVEDLKSCRKSAV
eukprot:787034-Heterocapsa_arctica.AAC.1